MADNTTIFLSREVRDELKEVQERHRLKSATDVLRGLLRAYESLSPQQRVLVMDASETHTITDQSSAA